MVASASAAARPSPSQLNMLITCGTRHALSRCWAAAGDAAARRALTDGLHQVISRLFVLAACAGRVPQSSRAFPLGCTAASVAGGWAVAAPRRRIDAALQHQQLHTITPSHSSSTCFPTR